VRKEKNYGGVENRRSGILKPWMTNQAAVERTKGKRIGRRMVEGGVDLQEEGTGERELEKISSWLKDVCQKFED
jgi:hypothetical protein